jgi:hypothetical protein
MTAKGLFVCISRWKKSIFLAKGVLVMIISYKKEFVSSSVKKSWLFGSVYLSLCIVT